MRRRLGLCLNDGEAFAAGVAHLGRYEASATNRRRPHPNPLIPRSEGFGGCSPAAWGFRTTAVPRFRTPLVQRRWSPRAFACRVEKRQDYCRRAWVAYLLLGGLFLPARTCCRNSTHHSTLACRTRESRIRPRPNLVKFALLSAPCAGRKKARARLILAPQRLLPKVNFGLAHIVKITTLSCLH